MVLHNYLISKNKSISHYYMVKDYKLMDQYFLFYKIILIYQSLTHIILNQLISYHQ